MSDDLTPDSIPKPPEPQEQKAEDQAQPEFQISEQDAERALEVFRQEQNLVVGSMAGLIAAVSGAAVWAGVTVVTEYQIGWMAVGLGFLVGIAIRTMGRGIDQVFGVVGAVMALVGCVLGNVFTIAWYISAQTGSSLMSVLTQLDMELVIDLITETFQVMDILFYGLALYFGYKYAFRQLTLDDFNRALGRAI
jgi:FtsH-binding integral membrane protein